MYVAKLTFSYDKKIYYKGNVVPDEVAEKYPRLVEKATDKNTVEKIVEPDPEGSVRIKIKQGEL